MATSNRLKCLRERMSDAKLNAFIIGSEDPHHSEYVCEHDKRRAFISGFTGSAGTAVVTQSKAALWTDGRYWLQASEQLDSNWILMKAGAPDTPTISKWLTGVSRGPDTILRGVEKDWTMVLPIDNTVGIDANLTAVDAFRTWKRTLKGSLTVSPQTGENLVDQIWTDQPDRPKNPLKIQPMRFSGQNVADKLVKLREKMGENECFAMAITELDEICWLLNLRGSDIEFNPVFFAYCLVTLNDVTLFVDKSQISDDVAKHLSGNASIEPYERVVDSLKSLELNMHTRRIWMHTGTCNLSLFQAVDENCVHESVLPIAMFKSCKNKEELDGMRQCHIRDAAAKTAWLAWMADPTTITDESKLSEIAVADKLEEYRSKQDLFVGLSFPSISASGPNAAIIHYDPDPKTCSIVDRNKMFLMDSGAQYEDGTTDVTRTFHLGTPTEEEKDRFTRVLKGHIQLAMMVFPEGTPGQALDSHARRSLWSVGLNYMHGTGHGVGSFLNVHEGPQYIGMLQTRGTPRPVFGLKDGMVTSNEPGFYKDGEFGIRIESLVITKYKEGEQFAGPPKFLEFETITLIPIAQNLIDWNLMTSDEIKWLNDFHQTCLEKVGPLLKGDARALKFLQRACKPYVAQ
eukprot:261704_1